MKRFTKPGPRGIFDAQSLEHVEDLDDACWMATNAPIYTFNSHRVSRQFLYDLDSDGDGRIRAAEVRQAVKWLLEHLEEPWSGIDGRSTSLRKDAIRGGDKDEQDLLMAWDENFPANEEVGRRELREKLKERQASVTTEAVLGAGRDAEAERFRTFFQDLVDTVGGDGDCEGEIGKQELDAFHDQARQLFDWHARAAPEGQTTSTILPLGDKTVEAYGLYVALREKLHQYFALCDVLGLDEVRPESLTIVEPMLAELDASDAQAIETLLADSPLAQPRPDGWLDLEAITNRHFAPQLETFRGRYLPAILGTEVQRLDAGQWQAVEDFFAPYETWRSEKPESEVGRLGVGTLRQYVEDGFYRDRLQQLFEEREAIERLLLLKELMLYQRYMLPLVNSYISFPYLYDPNQRALFEMGTLIIDGRHFTFCVKVLEGSRSGLVQPDRRAGESRRGLDRHIEFSDASNMFVLYVDVLKRGELLYQVAVPVTSGTRGELRVGKVGVFENVRGEHYHARVVHIVDNPISLKEAIAAPFQKIGRLLTSKLEGLTAKPGEVLQQKGSAVLKSAEEQKQESVPATRASESAGGLLAGVGVAFAALGSSLAFITTTLKDVDAWVIAIGLLGAVAAVVVPATLVALIKLSKRNLGAILEGSGWAINSRLKVVPIQARTFTHRPKQRLGDSCGYCNKRKIYPPEP